MLAADVCLVFTLKMLLSVCVAEGKAGFYCAILTLNPTSTATHHSSAPLPEPGNYS